MGTEINRHIQRNTSEVIMTKQEIIIGLRTLATEMERLGGFMNYPRGHTPEMVRNGGELVGAAHVAKGWASQLAGELADERAAELSH